MNACKMDRLPGTAGRLPACPGRRRRGRWRARLDSRSSQGWGTHPAADAGSQGWGIAHLSASAEAGDEAPSPERLGTVPARSPRCPQIVRRELAKALPEICRALTEKVQAGDMAALKQLWTMAGLDAKPADHPAPRRDSSFARKTLAAFPAR